MDFKYNVSIIVPFYNSANTIGLCIESILSQLMAPESFELILINDGSTDNSAEICRKFKDVHSENNITIINNEHCGISAARNLGIKAAAGKYIMFADADDVLFNNTVHLMTHFFDMHYDETDAVFCHIVNMNNFGLPSVNSDMDNLIKNTGIINLNLTPNLCLDSVLPCVKNNGDKNILFDEKIHYGEDKVYFFEVTKNKMNAGYLKEAQYYKFNYGDSFQQQKRDDKILSEDIAAFAEKVLNIADGEIPEIYQHNVLEILNSHYADDSLWPHQYNSEKFKQYQNRIRAIMSKISTNTIMNHIGFDKYIKSYWLRQKPNVKITQRYDNKMIEVYADDIMLELRKNVEWTLRRLRTENNHVTIFGEFKLAAFDFLDLKSQLKFEAVYNGKQSHFFNVKPSFFGYYKNSRMLTNNMWGFQLTIPAETVNQLTLFVHINNVRFPAVFVNCANTVFNKTNKLTSATVGNVLVTQVAKKTLQFSILDDEQLIEQRNTVSELFKSDSYTYNIRQQCNNYIHRRIWMYNDNFAMIDNGFYQFSHDVKIRDGIERYYVIKNEESEVFKNADAEMRKHFVKYGTMEHILLFLNAEKIFTAFTSGLEWRALQHNEMYRYWDIFNAEVILLSHGALNQYWPWSFSPIRMCVDKVVISTYYEYKAWTMNNFWEKDLIPSGMPRYDIITKNAAEKPSRKILLALSWRMYLAGKHEILLDAATPRIALDEKYTNSSYFRNFMDFLNSPELNEVLEKNNVELDVNLHPQFNLIYREHINLTSPHVHITGGQAKLDDYMLMISDVSSIMFDFAVFQRPVMYFIPDITEFKAGCNHFREVIIPFENGLGPCAYTASEAVAAVKKIVENNFEMEARYKEKFRDFHLPLDGCCEKIYQYCKNSGKSYDELPCGNTVETIMPMLTSMKQIRNQNGGTFLKCLYDYIGQPYNKILLSGIDRNEDNLTRYFDFLKDKDRYVVCLAAADTAHKYWKDFNKCTGFRFMESVGWRKSYIAIANGNDLYEKSEDTALWHTITIPETGAEIRLGSRSYDLYENPKAYGVVIVNGINYSMSKRGINIVVYDKKTKTVCDSFNIDLYDDSELKMNRTIWDSL